jgi:hypothetical protein
MRDGVRGGLRACMDLKSNRSNMTTANTRPVSARMRVVCVMACAWLAEQPYSRGSQVYSLGGRESPGAGQSPGQARRGQCPGSKLSNLVKHLWATCHNV